MKKMKKLAMSSLLCLAGLWGGSASAANMVISSEIPVTTNPSPYIEQFIKEVRTKTDGRIDGAYFPASQLYNDRDGLAALGTGAVHMVWPVSSRLEVFDVRTGIVSLPFALTEKDLTNACFTQGFTKTIDSYLAAKGLIVLGFLRTADLLFIMRDTDVQKVADLNGKKVRVVGGKIMLDAMRAIGVSPVSMAASEMSAALSQGAIDGALTSPAGWVDVLGTTGKFGISVPGMSLATSAVVADRAWFERLSEADRKAIHDILGELIPRQWKETIEKDRALIQQMVDKGAKHRVLSDQEIAALRKKFAEPSAEFEKKNQAVMKSVADLRIQCKVAG